MITIQRTKINDFENKNKFLIDMFLNKYMTHVVHCFGEDAKYLVTESDLDTLRTAFQRDLSFRGRLNVIIREDK